MTTESVSIQAIQLVRKVFESVHGNLGLLKFNIEELTPTNGDVEEDSQKWDIICSFYETLGSTAPSRYQASVDLNKNTVVIKKLSRAPTESPDKVEGKYRVIKQEKSKSK